VRIAAEVGADWVGIFLGINPLSLEARHGLDTRERALERIADVTADAVRLGLQVRFTVEDASRTEPEDAIAAYQAAIEAGAQRICFADTVGMLTPQETRHRVANLVAIFPNVPLEVHFHDDRGLALANALAALDAGAAWISTSVNGLGERCGIVDLAALLANLDVAGWRSILRPTLLQALSTRVASYARAPVDMRRPVVGRYAFTHTARLHKLAMERNPRSYEWIDPSRVGRSHSFSKPALETTHDALVTVAPRISSTELRYHRHGPGERYVMIDERFVPDCRQYCIVRQVPKLDDYGMGHVDRHAHTCDSLFLFVGNASDLTGLSVEVSLGEKTVTIRSPASVFIPAGLVHSYRVLDGAGLFMNHVLSGSYDESLLAPISLLSENLMPIHANPKSAAWDLIGKLFWSKGRASARPTPSEVDIFLAALPSSARIAIVGASTKELIQAALARNFTVTVLDFSTKMCADLGALVGSAVDIRLLDITEAMPPDLCGQYDAVLSDRLINRFTREESVRALSSMLALLGDSGTVRTSVKLGFYPMDKCMIDEGSRRGTLTSFYDETTCTIDFLRAGTVLEACLQPHGEIDRETLLAWYRCRGRESRYNDADIMDIAEHARLCLRKLRCTDSRSFPDTMETTYYVFKAISQEID
jgi:2-isopropylmalate synthase